MIKKNFKLILIAGGTASGKTSIAQNLVSNLTTKFGKKPCHIELDNYYHEITHWKQKSENDVNWDEPSAINWTLLKSDLKKLFNGKTIEKEKFDFSTNMYDSKKLLTYEPSEIIIIEGIFALYENYLIDNSDYRIFVDTDADVRFIRRIKRDSTRHKFAQDVFINNWINKIKPMHDKWIQPQKSIAQLVIQNNVENIDLNSLNIINLLL